MAQFPSFFRLDSIPSSAYATFCFSIHPSMGVWVVPTSHLWWIMLLWTWECKDLFEILLLILWRVGMLPYGNFIFNFLGKCHTRTLNVLRYSPKVLFTSLLDMKYLLPSGDLWLWLYFTLGSILRLSCGLDLDSLPSVPAWCEWHTQEQGALRSHIHAQNLRTHYRERKKVSSLRIPFFMIEFSESFLWSKKYIWKSSVQFLTAGLIGFSTQNFFQGTWR